MLYWSISEIIEIKQEKDAAPQEQEGIIRSISLISHTHAKLRNSKSTVRAYSPGDNEQSESGKEF